MNTLSKRTLNFALLLIAVLFSGCSKETSTEPKSVNQQVISGFGGVNMPGWIPDLTADQVNKAFGTGPGQIGLSILRIRVPYDSTKFSLELPTAQLAKSLGITTIFASPWTPPAWMKSNNNIVGGTLPDSSYPAYVAHLKSFANYMSANGVPLFAISLQNEPDATVGYESCHWNATQLLNFVKNNAPSIGTKIIMPESMNFDYSLSDPTLNDSVAVDNVAIIGGHIYGRGPRSYPLAVSKGKDVWMTEHLDTDTSWTRVFATAKEIHDCINAGMNAYVWWYTRRFYGLIDDNSNVTKRGYLMSQYARFVRPGAVRVSTNSNPQRNVFVTAYVSGSGAVVVAINMSPYSVNQNFTPVGSNPVSFACYVTSPIKDCQRGMDIPALGGEFTATLDALSVTTFVSN